MHNHVTILYTTELTVPLEEVQKVNLFMLHILYYNLKKQTILEISNTPNRYM